MDSESVISYFKNVSSDEPEVSPAVAALKTLLEFMKKDKSETMQGLEKNIKSVVEILTDNDFSVTSVRSACELFIRFITLTALDHSDFKECKLVLSQRGTVFLEKVSASRMKIAKLGQPFILDDSAILIHSHSRVVYHTLIEAYRAKKRFHVYVTESSPDYSGKKMYDKLTQAGISATLILDSAIGYILEKINMVLLGAEGVVESGGIVNKIGSYAIAICAKAMYKPVYVLAESFKFVRLFPLNQRDLPNEFKEFSFAEFNQFNESNMTRADRSHQPSRLSRSQTSRRSCARHQPRGRKVQTTSPVVRQEARRDDKTSLN